MYNAASPLRYPGGKAVLYEVASQILQLNNLEWGHYAEPYAGGCGLALKLLFEGHVSDIHINDLDRAIWSFWQCVLNDTDNLIEKIRQTPITIDEWKRQREIYLLGNLNDPLELGFATFFLNRVNRSGIIEKAGVIGGFAQNGNYRMDCRFNKEELIDRIKRIQRYRRRIHLYNLDALDFMTYCETNLPQRTFLCIDPPYFHKGSSLYTNFYQPSDHSSVATKITNLNCPWILTYDYVPEINELYINSDQFVFDVNYTLQIKRVGTELLITSDGLEVPDEILARQINYRPLEIA